MELVMDMDTFLTVYTGNITGLKDNQVFVFGSNLGGFHGAGAAGFASFGEAGNVWRKHDYGNKRKGWLGKWNVKGQGEGFQIGTCGASWALPTVTRAGAKQSISLESIAKSVEKLYNFAIDNEDLVFLVAYSAGKGNRNLNGYTEQQMASTFSGDIPSNIIFEEGFEKLVNRNEDES